MALHHNLGSEEVNLINHFIKDKQEKTVVMDVGTNRGLFVDLLLEKNIEKEIHCFEPILSLFNDLKEKYKMSEDIILNNHGISDTNKEMDFFELVNPITDGCSSVIERPVFKERNWEYTKYKIKTLSIDEYCENNQIDFIDLIKIDVEGIEYLVFKGMSNLLNNGKIGIVQFEYGDTFDDAGYTLYDLYNHIKLFNYNLFYLKDNEFVEIKEDDLSEYSKINNINLIVKK